MMKNINILKEKAKQASVPVIYIHNSDDDFMKPGSRKWQLHKIIKPEAEYLLVNRTYSSSFRETDQMPIHLFQRMPVMWSNVIIINVNSRGLY